jgi:hypothetical protein
MDFSWFPAHRSVYNKVAVMAAPVGLTIWTESRVSQSGFLTTAIAAQLRKNSWP